MNPLDPKKAALARLLAQANTGLSTDLRERYAPKPPPTPVAEPAAAPVDPLAEAQNDPGLLERLMALVKPKAEVTPTPQELSDLKHRREAMERDPAKEIERQTRARMGDEAWEEEM